MNGGSPSDVPDRWYAGSTYEGFMGRWSRQLAPRFVSWLGIPRGTHWLDVGCGTGAMTEAVADGADPASVVGCDSAEPFIAYARSHARDARCSFIVAGVGRLPRRPRGYGSVTSLLALNFFPDPEAAVHELRAVAATSGVVSACVWDYGGRMEFLRLFWDAAAAVDASARELHEGARFPLCHPDPLERLFRMAGLGEVRCEPIEIPTEFATFDDYWRPFLGGTGPAPSYVASLAAERREALARNLEKTLPRTPAGAIPLSARAWAVRGLAS
jgi:SAM-dependent methyltransferase